jgi:hypothetical protein
VNGEKYNANEMLYEVISSRRTRWAEKVACMEEKRNAHTILDGKA